MGAIEQPTLLERLSKVQADLKVPKSQRNNFGNYNYRTCEDILEAVKPLLAEHGLILELVDEVVNIGERYYVKATAQLRDYEGNAGTESVGYAREEETKKGMDGSQITGAASSYARKYALNGLFLIDDTKDSDHTNDGQAASQTRPEKPVEARTPPPEGPDTDQAAAAHLSPDQAAELMQLAKKKGYIDKAAAIKFLNTVALGADFTKIPVSDFDRFKKLVIAAGWKKPDAEVVE